MASTIGLYFRIKEVMEDDITYYDTLIQGFG